MRREQPASRQIVVAGTDANMGPVRRMWIADGRAENLARRGWAVSGLPQAAVAVAALIVANWALADGFWPSWPLWSTIGLLAGGLIVGPIAQFVVKRAVRFVQPIVAVASLLVLSFGLPDVHAAWHVSPVWVIALLLCLGLAADPLVRFVSDRRVHVFALQIAAVAATLILVWELAADGYFYYTAAPRTLYFLDALPVEPMRAVVVLLSLGLLTGQLSGRGFLRGLVQPATTAVSLIVLVMTLLLPHASGVHPQWPLLWAAVALGMGLLADPFARLLMLPRTRMLSARVSELSRTRSGALDVQATELRRIERDLHDGAQVRLVALSMKLGRAEERYRDDPETAALLREAREDATAAIRELRELARGIAPPVLADRGLEAAVGSLAQRSGVEAVVNARLSRRPLPSVETAAYFVVAESLTNASKHAPGARVEIRLEDRDRKLSVEITDFGPGGADSEGGGLTGLRRRVEALDGVLRVWSPTGVGTKVEAVMPCGW